MLGKRGHNGPKSENFPTRVKFPTQKFIGYFAKPPKSRTNQATNQGTNQATKIANICNTKIANMQHDNSQQMSEIANKRVKRATKEGQEIAKK